MSESTFDPSEIFLPKSKLYTESEHQSLLEKAIADARFKHLQEATDKMFNVARERDDLQAKLDEANKRVEHVNLMLRTGAEQNLSLQGQVAELRGALQKIELYHGEVPTQVRAIAHIALNTPPPEPSELAKEICIPLTRLARLQLGFPDAKDVIDAKNILAKLQPNERKGEV